MRTAEKSGADIVRCNYNEVKGDKSIPMNHKTIGIQESYLEQCLLGKNHMNSMWLLLIKRRIFTDCGLSFETDINGCEDFLMTVKLFYYTNNITDIPDCLYDYNFTKKQKLLFFLAEKNTILLLKFICKFI